MTVTAVHQIQTLLIASRSLTPKILIIMQTSKIAQNARTVCTAVGEYLSENRVGAESISCAPPKAMEHVDIQLPTR